MKGGVMKKTIAIVLCLYLLPFFCFSEDQAESVVAETSESWADVTPEISYDVEISYSKSVFAEGECVDEALSILSIIKRDGLYDDTIKAATLELPEMNQAHVQIVKIDGHEMKFFALEINDGVLEVVETENQFYNTAKVVFYNADDFIEAANIYYPDMYPHQLRRYADFVSQIKKEEGK